MRSRLARIGVVAVGLLALVGVTTPPANAITVGVFAIQGIAVLDGPLGYPCADSTQPDTNFPKCPQGTLPGSGASPLTLTTKPLPLTTSLLTIGQSTTVELGTTPYLHGGNTRAIVSFNPTVCVGAGVNINKLAKAPAHAGICSVSGSGTVTGWCGLSTGLVTGTITDPLGQTYAYRIHFYGVASELFISGHATKLTNTPQTLLVRGLVNAFPLPTVGVPPGNSCAGKTATVFQVQGGIVAAG